MKQNYQEKIEELFEASSVQLNITPEEKPEVYRLFSLAVKDLEQKFEGKDLSLPKFAVAIPYLVGFTLGEYRFVLELTKDVKDEIILPIIEQKYLTFRQSLQKGIGYGREVFDPLLSTISTANTFFEQRNAPRSHRNPSVSLVNDIFETIFKKVDGFVKRMVLGLYTDALSNWRTVHESECILALLVNGSETVRQNYVKHINYSRVFRNNDNDVFPKEYVDSIFEQIKGERKKYNLKSKDRKKYIDYGWIYSLDQYDPNDKKIRLNFRFGVEYLAGLIDHSDRYEVASERDHASASFFFYSNDETCRKLALRNFYDSRNRIIDLYRKYRKLYFDRNPEKKKTALRRQGSVRRVYQFIRDRDNRKELFYDQKNSQDDMPRD